MPLPKVTGRRRGAGGTALSTTRVETTFRLSGLEFASSCRYSLFGVSILCANLIVLSLRAKFFTFLFIAFFPVFCTAWRLARRHVAATGFLSLCRWLCKRPSSVLQKAVNCSAKDRVLQAERWPVAEPLILRRLHVCRHTGFCWL